MARRSAESDRSRCRVSALCSVRTVTAPATVSLPAGTYTVTAYPASGYTFGDHTSTFTVTVDSAGECLVTAKPVAPTAAPAACTGPGTEGNGSIGLPDTTGVDHYTISGQPGTFPAGSVSLPAGTYTVTAFPASGYTFGDNASSFEVTVDSAGACLVTVQPVAPTASPAACTGPGTQGNGAINLGSLQTGVAGFSIVGTGINTTGTTGSVAVPAGTYTVTANALPGYTFGTNQSAFTLTVPNAGACVLAVQVVSPTATQFVCTKTATDATLTPPSYTLPDVTGIQWFVGNSTTPSAPGTYPTTAGVLHVVAQAQAGYVLVDNASSQTFDLTVNPAPTCVLGTKIVKPSKTPNTTPSTPTTPTTPTAVLPFTGSDTGQLLPMSVGFLAIGGLLMLAGRRRRTP